MFADNLALRTRFLCPPPVPWLLLMHGECIVCLRSLPDVGRALVAECEVVDVPMVHDGPKEGDACRRCLRPRDGGGAGEHAARDAHPAAWRYPPSRMLPRTLATLTPELMRTADHMFLQDARRQQHARLPHLRSGRMAFLRLNLEFGANTSSACRHHRTVKALCRLANWRLTQ